MATTVSRHPFLTGKAEEGLAALQKNALRLIDGLEDGSTDLGDALRLTVTLATTHCLLDPEGSRLPTWESWVNAMQVGSAVFAAATTADEHVQCRIADQDRTLRATGMRPYVNPESWLTALYLAVVCREKKRIAALCQVPISLLRESGSRFAEYDYAWIDALQTYWLQGSDLGSKLRVAIDATEPETVADPETVGHLVYPQMELFHRFIRRDHTGFNRALIDALEWHKRYWSQEGRDVRASGLVALAPLAMACLAHDTGTPIEVQSEYLPIALLERDWCGEFPT
ncbi:immunity 49 family protein [Streptomyces kaniharaensis]|uniref:Immunity 49 family protein n=1 Tax=Streptomyces kaniharaensis TaxID=212423 RepID=A0A6N7KQ04_9ACTN|nr:immunity 49 family protein [Streptomyces kaniharaensis]MQS12815.1 immunity 49 family protein [Streptomyces kaniharaensis]